MARARRRPVSVQGQEHGAPVLGIVLALDEPGLGQGRREPGDDRGGHHQAPRDLGLRLRPESCRSCA